MLLGLVNAPAGAGAQRITEGSSLPANPVAKNEKAARDFEALLLAPALDALQKTFAGTSEGSNAPGADDYRQMGTQALAQAIAARGGIGIACLVLRHLHPKVSGGKVNGGEIPPLKFSHSLPMLALGSYVLASMTRGLTVS